MSVLVQGPAESVSSAAIEVLDLRWQVDIEGVHPRHPNAGGNDL
jgi:hypothetical protein